VQRRTPLPSRFPKRFICALATLTAAFVPLPLVTEAGAQWLASWPLQPSLTDPLHPQRFRRTPERVTRASTPAAAPVVAPPSGSGETGFDSTGSRRKKKAAKRDPGDAHLPPPPPLAPPGPPQQAGGHTGAPQLAARASYAEAYRPPDAPPRRPLAPVQDPYEPPGLRVGTFLLRPSLEVARGYDSNPTHRPNGASSAFVRVAPELQIRSQWSRHQFDANLRGSYIGYDTLASANQPFVDAKTSSRIDVSRDTRIDFESRLLLSTDYPGSPNLQADLAKLPVFLSYGGTAGLTQRFNRLELTAKVNSERTSYLDSQLTDGTISSNHDRDFNQYGAALRASYEVMPGVKPFVEIGGDTRRHDLPFDRNGFQRDSNALTPRAGTTFEISRKLTGEVSAGYLRRRYEDASLPELRGAVADAALVWTASALTSATLRANSRAEESVVAGVSGALRRDAGLQIDHAFRRWLVGTLKVGYGFDQYVGNGRDDTRGSLGLALTYKLNRDLSLNGEYRYERLRSNAPDAEYDASIVMIGLKLQR
jgi:hypothetical protein